MCNYPDCYQCKYHGGSYGGHSSCHYPGADAGNLFAIFEPETHALIRKLRLTFSLHGFEMGWFMWPHNYDPAWLYHCDGFTPKEEANDHT